MHSEKMTWTSSWASWLATIWRRWWRSAFVSAAAQVRVTIQTVRVQIRRVQRHVQFIAAHHFETGVDNSFLNIDGKLFYCAVPPPAPIRAGAHVISGWQRGTQTTSINEELHAYSHLSFCMSSTEGGMGCSEEEAASILKKQAHYVRHTRF